MDLGLTLNQAVYVPVSFPGGAAMLRHKAQFTKRISRCLYMLHMLFFLCSVLIHHVKISAAEAMERSPEKRPVNRTDDADPSTPASGDGGIRNHVYRLFIMKNFTPQPRVRRAPRGSRLDLVTPRRLGPGREPIKPTPPQTDCLLTLCAHLRSGGGQCVFIYLFIFSFNLPFDWFLRS